MKRWTIRIGVCLLLLLVMAGVAIHVVLQTDLPRRWILRAAREQTGLDLQAESVSIRWSGRTTLRNVAVRMPLSDRDVLSAKTLGLSHTSVPVLLLTRSFRLESIRVENPQVYIWRDGQGRWNLQDVADRLAATTGSSGSQSGDIALPNVDLRQGLVHLADPNGQNQTIGPVEFQGIVEKGSVWRFALKTPQGVGLHGELAKGGNWTHTIEFSVEPNDALVQAVLPSAGGPFRVAGRWEGRVEGDRLRGTLRLDTLKAGAAALAGTVNVVTQSDGLTLDAQDLVLNEPNLAGEKLHIAGGRVRISRDRLVAEQVLARTETAAGQLTGRWDFAAEMGECSATWAGRLPGQDAEHSGTCQIAVKSPTSGRKEAELATTLEAQTPFGTWHVAVQTKGTGGDWRKSLWQTSARQFTWTRERRQVDLSGAAADVLVDWPNVRLANLSLPNAEQVDAGAEFHVGTRRWAVRFDAKGLQARGPDKSSTDIYLSGEGDHLKAVVSDLRLTEGQTVVAAKGELSMVSREVRNAHISAKWPDRSAVPSPAQPSQMQNRGQWGCEIDITGKVQPVELYMGGTVAGQNVRLGKRRVAHLEIPVQAKVSAENVQVTTAPFDLLGGRWQLSGQHELSEPMTQLRLTINDLSLQTAAEMAGSPIECQGQAGAQLQLTVPDFRMERAVAYGRWEVADLNLPPFEAKEGQGQIRISDGLVKFDEIELTQGQGRAQGAMQFRLDQPQRLSIKFNTTGWPVRWNTQPVVVVADSEANLELDVVKKSLDGKGRLSSRLLWQDKELGRMSTSVRLHERMLEVEELRGDLLGGSAEGTARIRLDRWTDSTGQLQWQDISPDLLTPWWPQAARSQGKLSGSLTVTPTAEQQRPLEPMRLEIKAQIPDGRFGPAQVQDCNVVAYLGSRRFLIDKSTLNLLGGQIKGRARISPHAGELHLSVATDFNNVDLNQLSHLVAPDAKPVAGKLAGKATLLTSSDGRHLSGQADLSVTQSDLANNAVVRTLYNTLSLDLGQTKPEGTGQMGIVFEGTRVRIPSFIYFNRGVEIRGAGQILDFGLGSQSPVEGYAVGSTRVLKGVQLPGVRQLDRLMSSLQTGIASVTINGTVSQTKVNVVPLPAISDAFRGLLWTQLRE